MEDRRIREIATLVESGRYDLLSLDLFDTVIYRRVPAPKDVFLLLGRELLARGSIHPSSSPESFHRERVGAEMRARKRRPSGEVTLAEIYGEFPGGYLRGTDPVRVMGLELELEKQVVRVNPDMRKLIAHARSLGLSIAFVSDTYLDEKDLRDLVGIDADHWIVSSAHRVSKYQGLHRVLIERSGVAPGRILHVGNDRTADVDGPEPFGIDRYWFRVWPEAFERLTDVEIPPVMSRRSALLSGPDAGLTTLRSRAMFRAASAHEAWGAGVLGPIVTGFSEWVLSRCREEGIDTALCLMREGRLMKTVLEKLDGSLKAREVFVSRFVARKSAIFQGTVEELESFLYRPSAQKRGRLLGQLGLEKDSFGGDPDERISPEETKALIRRVAGDPALRRRVVQDSKRCRSNLLAHIESVSGGEKPARAAIVDLGYKGTIQECLERIFRHEGWPTRTHGLYLVTGGDVHETQATGAAVEGWLAENGQPIAMAHTFMRSPEITEQSLMAACGTTLGHEPDGTPILDAVGIPEKQCLEIAAVQRGVLLWTAVWRESREEETAATAAMGGPSGAAAPASPDRAADGPNGAAAPASHDRAALRGLYQAIAIRSVARPLPVELDLFGDWEHDENFGSRDTRRLAEVQDMDDWECGHISAHQVASLPMSRLYWPFGFAHRLNPVLGEAVASIFLRSVESQAFDAPTDDRYLVVYWDTGSGFNAEEASVHPYRVSNRGTVWQRFTFKPNGKGVPLRMGFTIGLKDQIIRMSGVRVRAAGGDGAALDEHRYDPERLGTAGYRPLGRGLFLVEEDPALFVVPIETPAVETRQVDVDLFFGLVPGA